MFLRNIKSWEYFRLLSFFFFFFFTTSHLLPLIYRVCFLWIQKQEFHAVTQISIPSHTFPCASSLKAKKTQSFAWNLQLAWIIFFQLLDFLKMSHFAAKEKVSGEKMILLQERHLQKNVKRRFVLQTRKNSYLYT